MDYRYIDINILHYLSGGDSIMKLGKIKLEENVANIVGGVLLLSERLVK